MNNLKPIMKEKVVETNLKPGLLKKKPFGKSVGSGTSAPSGLMQRLTGKC